MHPHRVGQPLSVSIAADRLPNLQENLSGAQGRILPAIDTIRDLIPRPSANAGPRLRLEQRTLQRRQILWL
jgi:hypothetical protein